MGKVGKVGKVSYVTSVIEGLTLPPDCENYPDPDFAHFAHFAHPISKFPSLLLTQWRTIGYPNGSQVGLWLAAAYRWDENLVRDDLG